MNKKDNKQSNLKLDILAFGAHPDDIEVGCGGLLIKSAKKGYKTGIVDMSYAELSTNGNVELRIKEADEARKILGAKVRENLGMPNNFFFNSKEVQDKVIRVIRKYQPEMVLLPYYFDRHPDHEETPKIIRQSLFTSGLIRYETGQKNWRPKYVFFYMMWYDFKPTIVVNITDEWETKIKALMAYKSQFKLDKNRLKTIDNENDTIKMFESRDRYHGFSIGKTFGEPYFSLYPIGVEDPFNNLSNFF